MPPRRTLSIRARSTLSQVGWNATHRQQSSSRHISVFSRTLNKLHAPDGLTDWVRQWALASLLFNVQQRSRLEQREERLKKASEGTASVTCSLHNCIRLKTLCAACKMRGRSHTCTTHACCVRTMSGVGWAALPSPCRCASRCYKRPFLRCRLTGVLVSQAPLFMSAGCQNG